MYKGKLENWQEIEWAGKQTRLYGNVHVHENAKEGEEWITNEVETYYTSYDGLHAITASCSDYSLGEPAKKDRTLEEIIRSFREN